MHLENTPIHPALFTCIAGISTMVKKESSVFHERRGTELEQYLASTATAPAVLRSPAAFALVKSFILDDAETFAALRKAKGSGGDEDDSIEVEEASESKLEGAAGEEKKKTLFSGFSMQSMSNSLSTLSARVTAPKVSGSICEQ